MLLRVTNRKFLLDKDIYQGPGAWLGADVIWPSGSLFTVQVIPLMMALNFAIISCLLLYTYITL